jgi:hypothetical protein
VPRGARTIGAAAAAFSLATIASVGIGMSTLSPFELFIEVPRWLRVAGVLPILAIPLALGVVFWLARARSWTLLARLHYALLAVALWLWTALAWSYHLIGLG